MDIYLPIAEISQNVIYLLSIGFIAGILSGMFGVGGGFLTTPILIIGGIPAAVAVGSEANHIAGSSLTGFLTYFRRMWARFESGRDLAHADLNISIRQCPNDLFTSLAMP